jgi:hypothetical protein
MTHSIILLATLAFAHVAMAVANADVIPWQPMDMTEVRRIYEDRTIPDTTVIKTLAQMLDQRISMSASTSFGGKNPNFAHEYGTLIYLMGSRARISKAANPAASIQSVAKTLGHDVPVKHAKQLHTYLAVAAALAGDVTVTDQLLPLLDDPATQREIVHLVLVAFSRSQVPIAAVPRLLELTKDPWHHGQSSDVGPRDPREIYPMRDAACACLAKLAIACRAPATLPNDQQPGMSVDRAEVVARVRAWLLSDDPVLWQPAAEVATKLAGDDIVAMVRELSTGGMLSAQKKAALTKLVSPAKR